MHNASALAVGPDIAAWEAGLKVDLMAAVHACNRVIPWMTASGGGNVRVNAIAPGSIEFPGGTWAQVKEHQPSFYQRVRASIPSGRMGMPEEVADVAVFLCSPRAAWIIGECVVVDGGQHRAMR